MDEFTSTPPFLSAWPGYYNQAGSERTYRGSTKRPGAPRTSITELHQRPLLSTTCLKSADHVRLERLGLRLRILTNTSRVVRLQIQCPVRSESTPAPLTKNTRTLLCRQTLISWLSL
jgi:hypothetical protein